MTYCLALNLNAGLVLLTDSRTNAGVDHISTYGKLFTWAIPQGAPNARALAIATAGNLSVTQEILALIDEENRANGAAQDQGLETILSAPSMFRVATRVGQLMADVQARQRPKLSAAGVASDASLLVAGEIAGDRPHLYMVYSPGNFIEATPDTPFQQIGEFKYGKPILDRSVEVDTPLATGVKAAVLSMDATLRSNLSVGAPLDLAVSPAGSMSWTRRRIEEEDPAFEMIRSHWREKLMVALDETPEMPLQG